MHIVYYESFLKYTRGFDILCAIDVILTLFRAIRPAVAVVTAVAIPVVAVILGAIFGTLLSKAFVVIVAAISA